MVLYANVKLWTNSLQAQLFKAEGTYAICHKVVIMRRAKLIRRKYSD